MRTCTITIVAVSSTGQGVTGTLTVTVASPGSGRVYISTSPASEVDTQGSARLAAFAASLLAGEDMSRLDFFYDIESDSIIVGGPSAGLAMALATLLALEGQPCNTSISVTGMIQPDTSIGPVGGLKEKLEAAAAAGKKLFLIPAGQEVYTYYRTVYKRIGPFIFEEREPVTVNLTELGESLGVRVVTVATLERAYEAVTGERLVQPAPPPGEPGWLASYLANRTLDIVGKVEEINTTITHREQQYIRDNINRALELAGEAENLSSEAPYTGLLKSLDALERALTAYYADQALNNGLEVTGIVESVNETITSLYASLNNTSTKSPAQAELEARAWGVLGVAAYYYQDALKHLDNESGHYYLRRTLLGAVDPSPLELLARAKRLAVASSIWANASLIAPASPRVNEERLAILGRLLMAEARTAVAYTDTLIREAGASADTGLPAFLTEQSMLAKRPEARIGYAIEAISIATGIIHEVFTLDPQSTASGLFELASYIYERSGNASTQAPILLELALHSNTTTALLASSKAVIYAWLAETLKSGPAAGSPTPAPLPPPGQTETPGTGGQPPIATPAPGSGGETVPSGENRPGNLLPLAAAVLAVGIVLVLAALRRSGS